MYETDESANGMRLRTSARRTSGGQSGVWKIRRPKGRRESRIVGELSIFTQPEIPEVPQPIFSFSSDAAAMCASVPFFFQIFLHFEGGHAPAAGGGDGLAVTAVLDVSTGEHSWNFREHVLVCDEISVGVGVELASEDRRVRDVADAEEHRAGGEIPALATLQIT